MKKQISTRVFKLVLLAMVATLGFISCSDDSEELVTDAVIKSFSIVDAGQSKDVVVEGVISGDQVLVVVPYETDLTQLTSEVTVSSGATVTPASGTTLDYTEPRNYVVTNGTDSRTYEVVVTKADPESAVLQDIVFTSAASGEIYETELDLITQSITVMINNLQSTQSVISTLSYGPNGAIASVSEGDTIDLSAEENVITINYAGVEKSYTITVEISDAGFDPEKTITLMDKSSLSGLVPNEMNDNASRGADFNGTYVFVVSRTNGNHVYYYDINASVFEAQELSMTGVEGGTWAISDVKTVGDVIYASNMVMGETGKEFKVYKWDNVNDLEPEVVLSYITTADNQRLGDALSIVGNPALDGYIMASNFPAAGGNALANEFFAWKATSGSFGDATIWDFDLSNEGKVGQYGRINAIPDVADKFIVTGAESLFIIDAQGNIEYEVDDEVIQGRAMDAEIFEFNGGRYLSYTVNREWEAGGAFLQVVNISEGADAIEGIKALTFENINSKIVYQKNLSGPADPWVNANTAVVFNADDTPEIFSFTVLSGFVIEALER